MGDDVVWKPSLEIVDQRSTVADVGRWRSLHLAALGQWIGRSSGSRRGAWSARAPAGVKTYPRRTCRS